MIMRLLAGSTSKYAGTPIPEPRVMFSSTTFMVLLFSFVETTSPGLRRYDWMWWSNYFV